MFGNQGGEKKRGKQEEQSINAKLQIKMPHISSLKVALSR